MKQVNDKINRFNETVSEALANELSDSGLNFSDYNQMKLFVATRVSRCPEKGNKNKIWLILDKGKKTEKYLLMVNMLEMKVYSIKGKKPLLLV